MTTYHVVWEIDIETEFDSPLEAAEKALAIHRDPGSIATAFVVIDSETGERTYVDLEEED